MKHKDALTDLVEEVQGKPTKTPNEDPKKPQQVTGVDGDVITLGQKPSSSTKGKAFELSQEELERVVKDAVTAVLDRLIKRREGKK